MSSAPLVSILIPVYNREALVLEALQSAASQTYSNIEVIVVDNASTDRTFDVVCQFARRDPRIRCHQNKANVGPVRNWRKCLEYSQGAYVKILFSDDWLSPEAVELLLQSIDQHAGIGFAYSTVSVHDDRHSAAIPAYQQPRDRVMPASDFLVAQLVGWPPVPVSPGCALFRREDLEKSLDVDFPEFLGIGCSQKGIGQDLLVFLKICSQYRAVAYVEKAVCHFRSHRDSISMQNTARLCQVCYDSVFGYFLANASLEERLRRRLHGLLWLRSLNPLRRWVTSHLREPVYPRLFPPEYDSRPKEFNWRDLTVLFTWLFWQKMSRLEGRMAIWFVRAS